jgi:hypothetical protein
METLDITEADIAEDPTGAADKLDKLARHAEDLVIEADEGFAAMMARLPRLRCMVLAAAIQALGARRNYFDRNAKQFVAEPDWSARLKAIVWIGSYSDGLPAQTTLLKVDAGANKLDSLAALRLAARESPAMRETLREMLAELEKPAELGN